ncbi:gag-polypeptide of LTR copia-type [Sesbania bispinosa]|nr:gag-polypeptide of LTR copia-type [Sesbania bispinosa]
MSSPNGDNNSNPSSPQVTPSTPVISIKLSGSTNYPAWRVQFNALLVGYGLKGYVDGSKPCPAKYCDDACITINPNYECWVRQDQLIVHAIISSVEPTLTTMLGSVKTSKDAWDILCTMYANKSRSRILSLKEKLSQLTKVA